MRNGEELRMKHIKWVMMKTIAIVVFVVDVTVYVDHVTGEFVAYNSEVVQRVNYEGDQVWRIYKHNDSVNNLMKQLDEYDAYSIWSDQPLSSDIFIQNYMIDNAESMFKNYGIEYKVLMDNVQEAIEKENIPLSVEMKFDLERRKGHRMEWTRYHNLEDIYGYLDYLAVTFPDVCSVMSIGTSIEGRPLKVIRISSGKSNASAMWIDGGIHAREWISPAAVTYIINYLIENSNYSETDYYILPVANPDGYEYTFTTDRLWRKNRRKHVEKWRNTTCTGVDLNRNFGYLWGGKGASKNKCHETYSGTGPFSEPETVAFQDFFSNTSANLKAFVTFHSYGQYILYPWGYDKVLPPDHKELDSVGRQAAKLMKQNGEKYTVGNSAITLYPAAGGSDDWAKAVPKIKYAYTIELRDTGFYKNACNAKS